jgi:hypothetical protein
MGLIHRSPLVFAVMCHLVMLGACSSPPSSVLQDRIPQQDSEVTTTDQTVVLPDVVVQGKDLLELVAPDMPIADGEGDRFVEPQCQPGEGCFLDDCNDNSDCQSGWCVEHLGEGVCSQLCQEECPPGWSCKAIGGGPDLVYVCVSNYSNLCKPCATTEGCKSPGGAEDVCLAYGDEGSFCGGLCQGDDDCPWGFSCVEAQTVEGVATQQCVADTGVCPCAKKSVALSLTTPCQQTNDVGTCVGKRVCTDEGLSDCDAGVPAQEVCNGIDDDCDGDVDEATCDDDNDCTEDSCSGAEGCVNTPLDATECKDGDPCTVADHCESGVCVGDPVQCDDNNPCTQDICTPQGGCDVLPATGSCDDDDPCTVADQCQDGDCVGTAVSCDCQEDGDCGALEDGDLCNGTLYCDTAQFPYKCAVKADTVVECPEAEGHHAPCLEPWCNPLTGACSLVAAEDGGPCVDQDKCSTNDTCQEGSCMAGPQINCNDGNPCTNDGCEAEIGCTHEFNDNACSDGNVCTAGDQCAAGECTPGQALVCDDGNPCNGVETCDQDAGCKSGLPLSCDDDNACTYDGCDPESGCWNSPAKACGDGDPCTVDTCDGETGDCIHTPVACDCALCQVCACDEESGQGVCLPKVVDDNNACTVDGCDPETGDLFHTAVLCDDDDICTDNSCDPAKGCVTTLNVAPCDDGDLCTTGDHCHLGACIGAGELACNDGNICTDDSCQAQTGCQFLANNAPCDDGSACTVDDACQKGWCTGNAVQCDDNNPCTNDSCSPELGCQHTNNQASCEDGNACTVGDTCANGVCQAGTPSDCDDGNPCTDDACGKMGCVYISNDAPCQDGNACTENDYCEDTICLPGTPVNCDDSEVCTNDSCDVDSGCVNAPNDLNCDDNDLCTIGDFCNGGECQPGEGTINCNDNIGCTVDTCEPTQGCVHTSAGCCGDSKVDPGEDCDDGAQVGGDGCNEFCQFESYAYNLGIQADDFDVAYDRRLVAVGRDGSNVVAQCFDANRNVSKSKFTVFQAAAGAVVDDVRMGIAGNTGHFAVLIRHQTIAGDWASRRGTMRLYDGSCNPMNDPYMFQADEVLDEGRDIDLDTTGHAHLTWLGKDKKMYLLIMNPDGTAKVGPKQFATCPYNFSTHIAVQPDGTRGVITCQGHASNPIWFWLYDANGNITKAKVQVTGPPPSSWYDSHEVGMNSAGSFVVLWADSSNSLFHASSYDLNGTFVKKLEVGATNGNCFDPFRERNTKIQTPNGDFILPFVRPGDGACYNSKHGGFKRISAAGVTVVSGDSNYSLYSLAMDNFSGTYVLDGKQTIRVNAVTVQ